MTARSMFAAPVGTTSRRALTASWTVSSADRSGLYCFSRNSRTVLDERPIAFACAGGRGRQLCLLSRKVGEPTGGAGTRPPEHGLFNAREGPKAHLPCREDAARLGEVQARARVVVVEADDEARDAKRPNASRLGVLLRSQRGGLPSALVSDNDQVARGSAAWTGRQSGSRAGRTCWMPAMWRVMYSTVTGSSTVRRCDWHSMRARSIRMRASAVKPGGVRGVRVS